MTEDEVSNQLQEQFTEAWNIFEAECQGALNGFRDAKYLVKKIAAAFFNKGTVVGGKIVRLLVKEELQNLKQPYKIQCDWCDLPIAGTFFTKDGHVFCSMVCQNAHTGKDTELKTDYKSSFKSSLEDSNWPQVIGD